MEAPNYKVCADGYKKTRKECNDWRDEGYSSCQRWSEKCVLSWIPLIGPLICKVFEWICTAAVWIAQWACHGYNVFTTFICTAWESAVAATSLVGTFFKWVLSLPIIGAAIKEAINVITGVAIGVGGFIIEGFACGLLGICPTKKLRLCLIRTRGTEQDNLQPLLDNTKRIFKEQANVTLYIQDGDWGDALEVEPKCSWGGWAQDLWLTGSRYEEAAALRCRRYTVPSILGLGSPIYAFAVKEIAGTSTGCSLGPLTNYVVFEAKDACGGKTHLAHEMGHACNLLHPISDDPSNLMNTPCTAVGRDQLSTFQKLIVRGSKYVTFF
ncbi:MAG TPA: hypothetical protein VFS48_05595 [Solirubrobacterales bacterium]|nr:hypothetical protein [Solirubrobacterales bacterium]